MDDHALYRERSDLPPPRLESAGWGHFTASPATLLALEAKHIYTALEDPYFDCCDAQEVTINQRAAQVRKHIRDYGFLHLKDLVILVFNSSNGDVYVVDNRGVYVSLDELQQRAPQARVPVRYKHVDKAGEALAIMGAVEFSNGARAAWTSSDEDDDCNR